MLTSSLTMMLEDDSVMTTKNITQNGTYDATSEGYSGYETVTVNVSGGGPSVELMTRSDWDTLTTAQKQAKGLVAIQDANSGYVRGELVNGADYVPVGIYIPNSNSNKVTCEAFYDNFDTSTATWGNGNTPIQYREPNNKPTKDTQTNEIVCNAYQNGVVPYVNMGDKNKDFTVYFIGRISTAGSSGARLISCMYQQLSGYGIVVYLNDSTSNLEISKWGDSITTTFPYNQTVIIAIKNTNTSSVSNTTKIFMYSGDSIVTNTEQPYYIGPNITIARTDIGNEGSFPCASVVAMKYLAVVDEAEADATIEANIANLYSEFMAGE